MKVLAAADGTQLLVDTLRTVEYHLLSVGDNIHASRPL